MINSMSKKTNKVLLVAFQDNTDVISLKYLHSYLMNHNIESYILFLPYYSKDNNYKILEFVKALNPAVVGVSLMTIQFFYAKEFTAFIKKELPGIPVVWGGIHPSVATAQCLEFADFVFVGESEVAFAEYIEAVFMNKPTLNILNLAYKEGGKVFINKVRPYVDDLDTLPFPEYMPLESFILHKNRIYKMDKSLFGRYARYSGKLYSLSSSRGCPFSCSYCCNNFYLKLYGTSRVRQRSVSNIIEELKLAVRTYPDIVYISMQDDNFFCCDMEWLKDFASQFKKEKIGKRFICSAIPKYVNEEKLSILKEIGLSWITVGLQTGSQRVNKEVYGRFVSNEAFLAAARLIRKYNIACFYDIIVDNPYETESEVLDTINVLLKIPKPFMLQMFSLCFYYGTQLYEKALKDKMLFEDSRKKNMKKYSNTYLNKIIRLTPLLPSRFIKYLVNNRKAGAVFWLNLVYLPSLFILEPLTWITIILVSSGYNVFLTISAISAFLNTGFRKVVLKN